MEMVFFGHDFAYLEFFENIRRCIAGPDTRFRYFFSRFGPYLAAKEIKDSNLSCYYLDPDSVASVKFEKTVSNLDLKFYTDIPDAHTRCSKLFVKYLDYFKSCLPDAKASEIFFLLPGEFRLSEQAFIEAISRKYSFSNGLKYLYFESGPPGYIYLSPYGTNALANFDNVVAQLVDSQTLKYSKHATEVSPFFYRVEYKPILKAIDYLYIFYQRYFGARVDYQEYIHALHSALKKLCLRVVRKSILPNGIVANDGRGLYLLYCGQVNSDVNHTHFGVSTDEKIRRLTTVMEGDSQIKLIIRHHPLFVDSVLEKAMLLGYPDRIEVSKARSLSEDLEGCSGVITVNSNAGVEALLAGKPVYLLGDANYQALNGVFRDPFIFIDSIKSHLDSESIAKSTQVFLSQYFLRVDYRSDDYTNIPLVAGYISRYLFG